MAENVIFGYSPDSVSYPINDLVKRAALLDRAGIDTLWEGDHILPWYHTDGHHASIWVLMESYLQNTERAKVIGLIPPIGIRHQPVDVALGISTMDNLHPGRAGLCVAAGEAMNEENATGRWMKPRERVEAVEEATELIKKCWYEKDYFRHRGRHFKTTFFAYDPPAGHVPLYAAASGPRMLEFAGRECDGFISVGAPPEVYKDVFIPAFKKGVKESGRRFEESECCAWMSLFYNPDEEKALAGARRYGGLLIPECYHWVSDPRIIEERAVLVKDEALSSAMLVATKPDEIIERAEAYIKVGINHVVAVDGSIDGDVTAEVLAEHVLPYLKEQHSG